MKGKCEMATTATTTKTAHWTDELRDLHACSEAVKWAKDYRTATAAWKACERGDWMLWLVGRLSGEPESDQRKLVLCACECARLALEYVPSNETRPLRCIETGERWARGEATIEELREARRAAAADAADAAADAAYAAAVADAADAADAAYAAYAASAAADAREKTLKQCAAIVRKHFPTVLSIRSK